MSSALDTARCSDDLLGLVKEISEIARQIDETNLIPQSLLTRIRGSGILDLDEETLDGFLCKLRAIASASPAVAHTLLVHASAWLAAGKPSLERGTILALSVTEPGGGTDLKASLQTVAERLGAEWRIRGTKIFTSNAPYADYYIVLAVGPSGPTLYSVKSHESIEYELLDLTGLRGTGASIVRYNDSPGQPVGVPGKGVKEALRGINLGRLGYGAIALGIIDKSLSIIINTGKKKIIFGKELISYQGIKWRISNIYSEMKLIESIIEVVIKRSEGTWHIDPELAAITKVKAAMAAQRAAWASSQILGGRGLERWSEADRLQRDARALDIGEGAREVLLDYIATLAIKALSE